MNASSLAHAALALLAQAAIGLTTGNWWAGAAFGGAFYLGREVSQFETSRLAYFGKRASLGSDEGMSWYEGFKIAEWGADAKFDLAVPVVAVIAAAYFLPGVIR